MSQLTASGPPNVPPTVASARPSAERLVACYLAYLAAAGFGRWMMVIPDVSITIWPPNGVVLPVLLAHDRRTWPWWLAVAAAGELTANAIWFHNSILPALAYVAANLLEVLTAALGFGWLVGGRVVRLTNLPQTLAFLAICVIGAPVVGATLGSLVDAVIGKNAFQVTWPLWWVGDATGILIASPLVMVAVSALRERALPTTLELIEAIAIGVVVAGLGAWLYSGDLPYAFVLFVPLVWAALRFEMRGAAPASLAIALIVGFYSQSTTVPLAKDAAAYQHAMLQLFILVASSTGLIVAAIIHQHRRAAAELAAANTDLELRVAARTREIVAAEQRFRATFENAAVGMGILDARGRLIQVNATMADMLGTDAREVEGRELMSFSHPDDTAIAAAAWRSIASGELDRFAFEQRYTSATGEPVWGLASISLAETADGDEATFIVAIQDITGRKRAEEVRQSLMQELNHRSKNMLATVQAIARQTAQHTPDRFIEAFRQRLRALSENQDLLVRSGWRHVDLTDLARGQLGHFGAVLDDRVTLSGPPVAVSARAAQAIGMALHELSTNAAKHGSLANDAGRVSLAWRVAAEALGMVWSESGGPEVSQPTRSGFGSTVIGAMVKAALDAEVTTEFAPTGLVWRMRCPLASLRDEEQDA